ncbi:lysophospholipid acyltransferase family protein [soil metagenome]
MAVKARQPALDYAVYCVIRCTVAILQTIPMSWAFACADGLAWLAYRVDKRHREVARENLTHAFPEKPATEVDTLVRNCYRHCFRLVIEITLLPRKFRLSNWRTYGRLTNASGLVGCLLHDRPALMVTAHFGNWELAGFATGAFGMNSYAIARVLDNPHLEGFFKQFRQRTGQTIIAKKDDFDRLESVLKAGGKVATLADQDAGPRGVFVNFFGRPASAHKAVALMAIEFNLKLAVLGVPRLSDKGAGFYYEMVCEDVIDPAEYEGRPDAVKAITQRYHDALERMIRRHPEQYFWLHRRWKTQPAVKKVPMKLAKAA